MIKKRKIKVPAASFGIGGGSNWSQMLQSPQAQNMQYMQSILNNTYQNPNQQYLQQIGSTSNTLQQMQEQAYYNNAQNQFKLDMLNRNPQGASRFNQAMNNSPVAQQINAMTTQQQTDAYSSRSGGAGGGFSNMSVGDLAAATTGGIASIAGYGPKSEATNRDEVVTQSLADVSKGISTGAAMGSAFGPMGTVIGAGVGAVIGSIGRKGREAEMTSFTEFDEGTLGTGLIGAFSNKGLRRERTRIRKNAMANRSAVRGTEQLRDNYAEDNMGVRTNVFADGGTGASLAYVDDGELISTPDGNIVKVPEQGNPTDSNLVSLPEGSKILSDRLKVPGTNKTFAQVGEEMMSTKKSKFNDKYAENAAKLNEMNNKSIHDQLFEMQEAVKAKKGIKRKYKNAVVAAENGDKIKSWSYGDEFKYLKDGKYDQGYLDFVNNTLTQDMIDRALREQPEMFRRFRKSNPKYSPTVVEGRKWGTDFKPSDWHNFLAYVYDNRERLSSNYTPELYPLTMAGITAPTSTTVRSSVESGAYPIPEVRQPVRTRKPQAEKEDYSGIVNRAASSLASLAPIISNLYASPEYQDTIYNPYASTVANIMRRRRYNVDSAIRDIERNRAINNYNASQINTGTGADMAFRLQNAANTARAIADVRAQENNINNEYLGHYANTLNALGEQWANESKRVQEANMANRAQARNIRRAGLSGLSQWAQNRELMRNQRDRDNMMMALYDPFLEAGFTTYDLTNFRNWLRRTNG